ncbi:hypothetical protein [Methanobacterium sp. ACI-7]|uniref:hypothetical protein n=1 Tax=unclassified Methanobacterium TaxID=2627676 RepID=UPI0039C24BBB
MKLKIAALLALCVVVSAIGGIQGVSATNTTTFYNVDLKNSEYLTAPSYGVLYVKGIQFPDKVALKVGWDNYLYHEQNYTAKVTIGYEDLFDDFNTEDYYFDVTNDTEFSQAGYWDVPYMDIDKDNMIIIQIMPYNPIGH